MMDSPLPISDDSIRRLLQGGESDVDSALTILWTHLATGLAAYALSILPPERKGDCQDVVSAAFVSILQNPSAVVGSPSAYLRVSVRNAALSQRRKQSVRDRLIEDVIVQSEIQPTPASPPDEEIMAAENRLQFAQQLEERLNALSNCAKGMGDKQREVAEFMLHVMRNVARWPSVSRIYEALKEAEPGLREVTVKDRRKEVVAKFNPILTSYGRNTIND